MTIRETSIRISGLVAEAKLKSDRTGEELAKDLGYSERTLREKSRAKDMCSLPFDKIFIIAGLAGYDIAFVKKDR